MAYRATNLGMQVQLDPERAAAKLRRQHAALGTWTKVARKHGVDYRTLTRWLTKLAEAGHDPRALEDDTQAGW